MAQVLVTKPGTLTLADKKMLRGAGIVPIETDRPHDVRLLQTEGPVLSGDDLFYAALSGMSVSDNAQIQFGDILLKLVAERRKVDGSPT